MDKFDQYKRLLRLSTAGLEILVEMVLWGIAWYQIYNDKLLIPFENKGNLMMVGLYVFYLIMFVYLYGGTKYAYYPKGELILLQVLGTLIANVALYIQIIVIFKRFSFPIIWPIFMIRLFDIVVIVILNQISDGLFKKLFPPKKLMLICPPEIEALLRLKLSGRKELYEVTKCVSAAGTLERLQTEVQDCDDMMLLIASPFMLLTAIAIKLEDYGSYCSGGSG